MNSLKTKCLRHDFEKFILLQIYLACDTMLENEQYKKHIDTAISTIGCSESELVAYKCFASMAFCFLSSILSIIRV